MATVVNIGPDRRWAELGDSLASLGANLGTAYFERKSRERAGATIQALADGKQTPLGATAELLKTGMSTEEIDRLLSNVYEEARSLRSDTTQRYGIDVGAKTTTRGQDISRDVAEMGDVTQRRGQDISLEVSNADRAAANMRAAQAISAEERMQGRALSQEERLTRFRAAQDQVIEGLRQSGQQRQALISGAIQSELIGRQGMVSSILAQQERRFTGEEAEKGRKQDVLLTSMRETGATGRQILGQGFEKELEEYKAGNRTKEQMQNFAFDMVKTGQGQLFADTQRRRSESFESRENALDRGSREQIAKFSGAQKDQFDKKLELSFQGIQQSAESMGVDVSQAKPENLGAVTYASMTDTPEILKDYTKQLGIDVKVLQPDGTFSFGDTKVGGIERLKLETANALLPRIYAEQLASEKPSFERGSVYSQLSQRVEDAIYDPKKVLPQEFFNPAGELEDSFGAARYLESRDFKPQDIKRWFRRVYPDATDAQLEEILDYLKE